MKHVLTKPIEQFYQAEVGLENYSRTQKLEPILKWAGGKEQELKYILPNLPQKKFQNYYEPFVGGGAVYTAIQANKYYINDKSEELIMLYRHLINSDSTYFFHILEDIVHSWDMITDFVKEHAVFLNKTYQQYANHEIDVEKMKKVFLDFIINHADHFNTLFLLHFNFNTENFIKEIKINLFRKVNRMKELEKIKTKLPEKDVLDNIETAFKSAFYMQFRHIYNHAETYKINNASKSAIFFFIRNFAYSGMFRYNAQGAFNVPYGGIGYNRKNIYKKIEYLQTDGLRKLLNKTIIEHEDFEIFLDRFKPTEKDFIFLDPPYDSEFSTYAQNEFTRQDQERLAHYLIQKCKAKWMLVIKNTDFIFDLYSKSGLNIQSFDKKYLVSFMNRNDKQVKHLLITNY
jgi:DNA adenine methylase